MFTNSLLPPALSGAVACAALPASAGQTFDAVKAKGFVQCAVNTGLAGFSMRRQPGQVDRARRRYLPGRSRRRCSAMPRRSKFVPTTAQQRFTALQSGEVDVLTRNATQTLLRDTSLGFDFAGVNYYDGQGFMVPAKKLGVKSAKELNGATVCVQPGTTTELNLADYFRKPTR